MNMNREHRCCNCQYGKILYANIGLDFYAVKCMNQDERADRLHACEPTTECELFTIKGEQEQ